MPNINYLQVCECASCKFADVGEVELKNGIPYVIDLFCGIYIKTKKPTDYCKRWKMDMPTWTTSTATTEIDEPK